ncbi:hypothetical protein M432DRAFT_69389 [Thermoascus aurantiacus ATCC 26904]
MVVVVRRGVVTTIVVGRVEIAGGSGNLSVVVSRTVVVRRLVPMGDTAGGGRGVVGVEGRGFDGGVVGRKLLVGAAAGGGRAGVDTGTTGTVMVCVTVTGDAAGHAGRTVTVTVAAGAGTVTVVGRIWTSGVEVIRRGVGETRTVELGMNLVVFVAVVVGNLKGEAVGVKGRDVEDDSWRCGWANEKPTRATRRKARACILSCLLIWLSGTKPDRRAPR